MIIEIASDTKVGINLTELPNRRKVNIVRTGRAEDVILGKGTRGAVYILQGRLSEHGLRSNPHSIRRVCVALQLLDVITVAEMKRTIKRAQARWDKSMLQQTAYSFTADAEKLGIKLTKAQLVKVASI